MEKAVQNMLANGRRREIMKNKLFIVQDVQDLKTQWLCPVRPFLKAFGETFIWYIPGEQHGDLTVNELNGCIKLREDNKVDSNLFEGFYLRYRPIGVFLLVDENLL